MRVKMSKQPPPAPTASAVGPCPTIIQIVGRPGTGSLPSAIAPPDHPPERKRAKIENPYLKAHLHINMNLLSRKSFKRSRRSSDNELFLWRTSMGHNPGIRARSRSSYGSVRNTDGSVADGCCIVVLRPR